jgi:hypothetical protein
VTEKGGKLLETGFPIVCSPSFCKKFGFSEGGGHSGTSGLSNTA